MPRPRVTIEELEHAYAWLNCHESSGADESDEVEHAAIHKVAAWIAGEIISRKESNAKRKSPK